MIERKYIVKYKKNTNPPKEINKEIFDKKNNNKQYIIKKQNRNIREYLSIKSHMLSERATNNNTELISSLNTSTTCKNNDKNDKIDKKSGTSNSFYKNNYKIMLNMSNKNWKKTEINKIKELLNKTQRLKKNNILRINKEIISFNNNTQRYDNEDKNSSDDNRIKNDFNQMIKSANSNNKRKCFLYLICNKNIDKEKKYNLTLDNNNENYNDDINDNSNDNYIYDYIKTEERDTSESRHKIRNILCKNFSSNNSKSKLNNLAKLTLNNTINNNDNNNTKAIRVNKSPPCISYVKAKYDYKKNKNNIKNVKLIDFNEINKLNKINNSICYNSYNNYNNKNENSVKYRLHNSPIKFDYHNNATHKINIENNENILKIETYRSTESNNDNNNYNEITNDIKNESIFKELIFYEQKLNDIFLSIKLYNNNKESGSMNDECLEFFDFYFNSSLNNKLSNLFSEEYYNIIIQSAINLQLFIIMFIYHISFDLEILNESISLLIDIFNEVKYNFYLLIKQFFDKNKLLDIHSNNNNIYFNSLKKLLKNANIYNIKNITEDEILVSINDNCTFITKNIPKLLNVYNEYSNKNKTKNYYNEFINIFNHISIITENDIKNFFYDKIHNINDYNNKKCRNISHYQYKHNTDNTDNNNYFCRYKNKKNDDNSFSIDSNIKNNSFSNIHNIEPKQKISNDNYYISSYKSNKENANNIFPPFIKTKRPTNKRYTLILDLDETLIHVKSLNIKNNSNYNSYLYNYNNFNQKIIHLRPGLFSFLNSVKPFYEIITFSCASKIYADHILKKIETNQKYFDHNLYRQHTTIYGQKCVKDISKIGRNIKEMIIVDNLEENFALNPDNGIKIAPYYGEIKDEKDDSKLFELQKLLILFYKLKYDDLRMAIKDYSQYIKDKISNPD